jgi:hypothetical protein
MNRITLSEVPGYVRRKEVFSCNRSLYSLWYGDLYIVYSYGDHFPIAVFDHRQCRWFINEDKYSAITSRHQREVFAGVGCYAVTLSTDHIRAYIGCDGDVQELAQRHTHDLRAAAAMAPLFAVMQGFPLQEAVAA